MKKLIFRSALCACLALAILSSGAVAHAAVLPEDAPGTLEEAYAAFLEDVSAARDAYGVDGTRRWGSLEAFYADWIALRSVPGFMGDDVLVLETDRLLSSAALEAYSVRVGAILSGTYQSYGDFSAACAGVEDVSSEDGVTVADVLRVEDMSSYEVLHRRLLDADVEAKRSGSWSGGGPVPETPAEPTEPGSVDARPDPIELGILKLGSGPIAEKMCRPETDAMGTDGAAVPDPAALSDDEIVMDSELPKTGGMGTGIVYAAGSAIALAGAWLLYRRRQRPLP